MSDDPRDRIKHYVEAWLPEVSPLRLAGLGGFIIEQLKADGWDLRERVTVIPDPPDFELPWADG